jgi:DNA-binding IclR family transcriptional regulator
MSDDHMNNELQRHILAELRAAGHGTAMSVVDAAMELGVHRSTAHRLIQTGKLRRVAWAADTDVSVRPTARILTSSVADLLAEDSELENELPRRKERQS